jgi:hypothetical protein
LIGPGSIIFASADIRRLNSVMGVRDLIVADKPFELVRADLLDEPLFEESMTWHVPFHGGIITAYTEKETKKKYEFLYLLVLIFLRSKHLRRKFYRFGSRGSRVQLAPPRFQVPEPIREPLAGELGTQRGRY